MFSQLTTSLVLFLGIVAVVAALWGAARINQADDANQNQPDEDPAVETTPQPAN